MKKKSTANQAVVEFDAPRHLGSSSSMVEKLSHLSCFSHSWGARLLSQGLQCQQNLGIWEHRVFESHFTVSDWVFMW